MTTPLHDGDTTKGMFMVSAPGDDRNGPTQGEPTPGDSSAVQPAADATSPALPVPTTPPPSQAAPFDMSPPPVGAADASDATDPAATGAAAHPQELPRIVTPADQQAADAATQPVANQTSSDPAATLAIVPPTAAAPAAAPAAAAEHPWSSESLSAASPGDAPQRRAIPRWALIGGVAGLLVIGYVGTAVAVQNRVPHGTTIGGVDISGKSKEDAIAAVREGMKPRAERMLVVTASGDRKAEINAAAAGLSVDAEGSVNRLVGFSLDPRQIMRQLSGAQDHPVMSKVDDATLQSAVESLAGPLRVEPQNAEVGFDDKGAVQVKQPVVGAEVDISKTASAIERSWLGPEPAVAAVTTAKQPELDQQDLDAIMGQFVEPATKAPVVVKVGGQSTTLKPEQIGKALVIRAENGAFVGDVAGDILRDIVMTSELNLGAKAVDAKIVIKDGAPVVTPSVPGASIDPAEIANGMKAAMAAADRTISVNAVVSEPKFNTEAANNLGVREIISEFSTNLTSNAGRTENITIAAKTVNGTLLKPGETFSLNDLLGKRTPEKGYNQAPVIMKGRLTNDFGGGVSQVATTLFNGMFFAGMKDVAHKPHSFYISRYPEGREATVNYPTVDLKFTNSLERGVLIEMWVGGGKVHTRFWGTKQYDIEATKGPRTNIKPPKTIVDDSPGCVKQEPSPGFNVVVTRIFKQGGVEVRREDFKSTYIPEDEVTCTAP